MMSFNPSADVIHPYASKLLQLEVSVLHNVAMLTLIVPKSDSVSVLRESFAAFEEPARFCKT